MQVESTFLEKGLEGLRSGNFKGISTCPVNYVIPWGHASTFDILLPALPRLAVMEEKGLNPRPEKYRCLHQPLNWAGHAVVGPLVPLPKAAFPTLVVVDGDKELILRRDRNQLQRLPHISGVVQHASGIDNIEAADLPKISFVKNRAGLDMPVGLLSKPLLHLLRALHALKVEIEREDP